MPKIRSLFLLGILIIILPFLGFPSSWKSIFMVILGFFVSLITFLHYKEMKKKYRLRHPKQRATPMFVEEGGSPLTETEVETDEEVQS